MNDFLINNVDFYKQFKKEINTLPWMKMINQKILKLLLKVENVKEKEKPKSREKKRKDCKKTGNRILIH